MVPVSINILKGCKEADRLSQRLLYEHCYADMIKCCWQYCNNYDDAAALYNEAMCKVFLKIHQLTDESNLMAWIRRIVVNTCVDHCRKKVTYIDHHSKELADNNMMINPEVYHKIAAEETMQLLKTLPLQSALVFNLFVIEGYRHEEIAGMLTITVGTSKWYLSEARRILKYQLEKLSTSKSSTHVI